MTLLDSFAFHTAVCQKYWPGKTFKIQPEVKPEVKAKATRKWAYLSSDAYMNIKVLYRTVKRHHLELVVAILSRVYF